MPELPEVETIRRQLSRVLLGQAIASVQVNLPKQVKGISAEELKRKLVGTEIVGLDRRAKMLIVKVVKPQLSRGETFRQAQGDKVLFLVFHLKMTGQLIWQGPPTKNVGAADLRPLRGGGHPIKGALEHLPNKYSHIIFNFRDGSRLYFNDQRQFGWVKSVSSDQLTVLSRNLGPEPLTKDFTLESFIKCMKNRPKSRIYQALLDQRCVVGVGNIYANESLFAAGIRPTRRCKKIKIQEYKKLYTGIKKILKKSIEVRGTTIGHYMDALGDFGKFSKYLKVYGREGEKCSRKDCSAQVKRIKIGGRSAFYCPRSQK